MKTERQCVLCAVHIRKKKRVSQFQIGNLKQTSIKIIISLGSSLAASIGFFEIYRKTKQHIWFNGKSLTDKCSIQFFNKYNNVLILFEVCVNLFYFIVWCFTEVKHCGTWYLSGANVYFKTQFFFSKLDRENSSIGWTKWPSVLRIFSLKNPGFDDKKWPPLTWEIPGKTFFITQFRYYS